MTVDDLGRFPVEGPEGRHANRLYHIPRESMLHVIHGKTHPVPLTFYVSNDVCHMGEINIPPGTGCCTTEPDKHQGDAVIYVEVGPITLFLPDTLETFEVREGEAMFLPEGTRYQCVNYTSKSVRGIFMIAPGL